MVAFWALQPGSTHWWLYILRPLFFSLPSNTDPICEIQQYPMRISWDEDMVLFKKDNQKGSIAWSPTLPEKVVPGNELGDMPISLGSEIRLEAALEHRCVLNFPGSSAGQAEAAQAQTQSKSLWEYRGDKHSEERAVNDEGCVSHGRVFLNPVVADTCSHPKADLTGGRDHRGGSQAAKDDNTEKACSTELKWNEMFPGNSHLH